MDGSQSLRSLGRTEWSELLVAANCSILSVAHNECCDAYVLSESSLFVYRTALMIKTCGTTSLLHIVPRILQIAYAMGASPTRVVFSHSGLLYPDEQRFPHTSFDAEVAYLHKFFPEGEAHVLGESDDRTEQHHIFVAEYARFRRPPSAASLHVAGLPPGAAEASERRIAAKCVRNGMTGTMGTSRVSWTGLRSRSS